MVADLEMAAPQGAKDGERGAGKRELRLWLRMLATTRLISQELRRRLRRDFEATLPQFDLLAQLYRAPEGLRLGELSALTMVTNGNVTGLIERLEKDGLIIRVTPSQDRRVSVARLTPAGRARFAVMAEAHEGWLKELTDDVGPAAIDRLMRDLAGVKASALKRIVDEGQG